jgi:hypothetical protein
MPTLSEFAVLGIITYAISFVLVDSDVLEEPRFWLGEKWLFAAAMLRCYFCTGFWVAIGVLLVCTDLPLLQHISTAFGLAAVSQNLAAAAYRLAVK